MARYGVPSRTPQLVSLLCCRVTLGWHDFLGSGVPSSAKSFTVNHRSKATLADLFKNRRKPPKDRRLPQEVEDPSFARQNTSQPKPVGPAFITNSFETHSNQFFQVFQNLRQTNLLCSEQLAMYFHRLVHD